MYKSETNLKKYRQIEDFAKNQGVPFYLAGRGIGHQIMVDEGYAWLGTFAVASDSHSNMLRANRMLRDTGGADPCCKHMGYIRDMVANSFSLQIQFHRDLASGRDG